MIKNKRCLLIVDDEIRMVRALKDFFRAKGFEIIEAYDGEQAINKYYDHNTEIDLILLDVMLPQYSGFEVLKILRKENCMLPIIMLTARGEEYDQLQGFEYGADDYISKPFSHALLLARIEAMLKRVGKDRQSQIEIGGIRIDKNKHKAFLEEQELELTKREFDLLTFFIRNVSVTFTREQLLNSVWGFDFEGDSRTVDTHIKQLRMKLGKKEQFIKTIHRVGYRFEVYHEVLD